MGAIPMDPVVRKGGDSGKPVTISHPESPVSHAFQKITEDLASKVSVAAIQQSDFVPIEVID
jgi:ATP-binding protein involved in chromosome partitioning